jgi:hypothetical protein
VMVLPLKTAVPSVDSGGAGAVEPSAFRCTPVTPPFASMIQLLRTPRPDRRRAQPVGPPPRR